uniref:Hemerythrin-like domain-containing protein n=1 Tax=Maylandia zebra TaxID=106582 RepID=A0A3P9D493_9CICH
MAPFPDEVDVFTGPHWRMKQLVGLYCEKLSNTNFNNNDFRSFLQSLLYNVHSDNKLSEMLSLFEKGLHEYEQLNYAQQLKERLEAFTQDFLPHMKEEEEVFQPMLMQYFSYEELKDIKKQVIAQHCNQQQLDSAAEVLKGFSLWSQAEVLQKAFKYADHVKTDYECEVHIRKAGKIITVCRIVINDEYELLVCDSVLICREKKHVDQGGIEPTIFGLQTHVITNCATGKERSRLEKQGDEESELDRGERRKTLFFGVTKRCVTQKLGGLEAYFLCWVNQRTLVYFDCDCHCSLYNRR